MTRSRLAGLVTVAVLIAAACGDGGDDDATTTEPIPATTDGVDATIAETTVAPATTSAEVPPASAAPTTAAPTATSGSETESDVGGTIIDAADAAGATSVRRFATFATTWEELVAGPGPFTAFLPTDVAFSSFTVNEPELTAQLQSDPTLLDLVLLYHTIDGELLAEAIATGTDLTPFQGEPITVEVTDGTVVLNGGQATVVEANLTADNGIVHLIDGVLLPPSLVGDG